MITDPFDKMFAYLIFYVDLKLKYTISLLSNKYTRPSFTFSSGIYPTWSFYGESIN